MPSLEKQIKSYYQSTQKPAGHEKKSRITRISEQATSEINYSLWKATKKLKRPQTHHPRDGRWIRSEKENIKTFTVHLSKTFKPNSRKITLKEENKLLSDDTTPATLDTLDTRSFTINEVKVIIKYLNPKKTGLRSRNQSNTAEVARNGNKIYQSM